MKLTRLQKERVCATAILILLTLFAAFAVSMGWIDTPSFFAAKTSSPAKAETVKGFTLTVLELDSADCILLEYKDTVVLADGGRNEDAGSVVGFLKNKGITKIDLVIATHPHADHIGGLDEVLNDEDFEIKRVILPQVPENLLPDTAAVEHFYDAVNNCGAKLPECGAGSVIKLADIKITVLAPLGDGYEELNDYSLVVRADCGEISVLLTGDAEAASEDDMLADETIAPLLDCDILKVAHHGGQTSTSARFIKAVSPKVALIPARADKELYGIMSKTISRLENNGVRVFDTCLSGRLKCSVKDGKITVSTAK